MDRGSTDHMDSLFQDCTTHIVNFCCHIEHIYVYVFVCFVFVIYYDLQVHFHIIGQINIHFNTSVMDRHCSDRCLHHHPYMKKICIKGLKGLCPHHSPTLASHGQISRYFCIWGVIAFPEQKQRSGHVRLKLGMVNCVACCVGIILSGLQYRFSSFRDGDVEIDHDNGDL